MGHDLFPARHPIDIASSRQGYGFAARTASDPITQHRGLTTASDLALSFFHVRSIERRPFGVRSASHSEDPLRALYNPRDQHRRLET